MRCIRGVFSTVLLSTLLLLNVNAESQENKTDEDVPEIRATRINPTKPVIDGLLDDTIWGKANVEKTSAFTQMDPDEGEPPTESTTVAVVYDDEALYIAL